MSTLAEQKSTYHHGDLRRELIEAAVARLENDSVASLSLRKLAAEVGVSHNAPYMHFPSRDALLAAIAQHGFRLLREELLASGVLNPSDTDAAWRQRLIDGCQAYVSFGTRHPNLFQVMFMEHDYEAFPDTVVDSMAALKTLTDVLIDGQARGLLRAGDANEFATLIWSLLHGVAVLCASRSQTPLPFGSHSPAQLTHTFVENLLAGLAV